jgi:hypothetical protein
LIRSGFGRYVLTVDRLTFARFANSACVAPGHRSCAFTTFASAVGGGFRGRSTFGRPTGARIGPIGRSYWNIGAVTAGAETGICSASRIRPASSTRQMDATTTRPSTDSGSRYGLAPVSP